MDDINLHSETNQNNKKQYAYQMIREQIITGQLRPGTLLVERQLCSKLGISRTPLREAIQQLAIEGMVNNIPFHGNLVSEIRFEDIARVYDVREYLEALSARLLAQSASPELLAELRSYLDSFTKFQQEGKYALVSAQDVAFHNCIIRNSGNTLLINIYDSFLEGQIRRMTHLMDEEMCNMSSKAHHLIYDALVAKDGDLAEKCARRHIVESKINYLKRLAPNLIMPDFPSDMKK